MPRPLSLRTDLSSQPLYSNETREKLQEFCAPVAGAGRHDAFAVRQIFVRDATEGNIADYGWLGLACTDVYTMFGGSVPCPAPLKHEAKLRRRVAPLLCELQCDETLQWMIRIQGPSFIRPDISVMYLDAALFPDAIILTWHEQQRRRDGAFDESHNARLDHHPNLDGMLVLAKPTTTEEQEAAKARVTELTPIYRSLLRLPPGVEPECFCHWPFP
ncbi:hypothetical protein [Tranquillimonas alkanivorans]|uniref:Uncharacterized protein n=1 Tax=Tranquillimonas alkanivorans TaxID=441119 RepID=A0A1I5WA37_9RHOB|nr:hypothetical protein [Tranquillimonas alkanivorans]SFQ16600.1 hypothetical protein SAMN04488047_14217 [Tranquillimonas alkanivorans]